MNSDLEKKLAELREDYKSKLPTKVNEIEQLWKTAQEKSSPENLTTFQLKVHSLHGTAKTYGFTEIGNTASQLETFAQAILEKPDQVTKNSNDIEQLLQQLKTLVTGKVKTEQETLTVETDSETPSKLAPTIYLLDNDLSYQANLITQMSTFGYKVQKFTDVESFLEQLNKNPVAIVVVNIGLLNEQLERALIENIKKPAGLRTHSIFVSTSGDFALRLKAVRLGAEAFFIKPFLTEDLINQIDHLLKSETVPYRILIVDDEIEVAQYNAAILEKAKMKTLIITEPSQIDRALHEFNPELILIDINMPECSGLELASIIRQQNIFQSTPIIYLSTESDKLKQLNAMNLGADDFVTKSTAVDALVMTVRNRVQRYKKIRSLLVRDNLTGLYNHTFIRNQLEIELKESMSLHNPLSIALIDLDKFKSINDTYGYQAGDHVLKSLGLMIRKRLRPNDIVGRYGGAKFLVILPNTTQNAAKTIIDDLRKQFLTLNYSWNQQIFNASFSASIAAFPEFHSANDLLEAVDDSISKSKRAGMNRVELAT